MLYQHHRWGKDRRRKRNFFSLLSSTVDGRASDLESVICVAFRFDVLLANQWMDEAKGGMGFPAFVAAFHLDLSDIGMRDGFSGSSG